jgi:hypothetical protein
LKEFSATLHIFVGRMVGGCRALVIKELLDEGKGVVGFSLSCSKDKGVIGKNFRTENQSPS